MPRAGDGCNILFLERGDAIRIEEVVYRGVGHPQAAAGIRRGGGLLLGQRPGARRLERPLTHLHLLSAARRDYLAAGEDPSVKTFIIEARGEPIGMATTLTSAATAANWA